MTPNLFQILRRRSVRPRKGTVARSAQARVPQRGGARFENESTRLHSTRQACKIHKDFATARAGRASQDFKSHLGCIPPSASAGRHCHTTLSQVWLTDKIRKPQCAFEMSMFMCPAVHMSTRSLQRPSSTHEPSDPPFRVVIASFSPLQRSRGTRDGLLISWISVLKSSKQAWRKSLKTWGTGNSSARRGAEKKEITNSDASRRDF